MYHLQCNYVKAESRAYSPVSAENYQKRENQMHYYECAREANKRLTRRWSSGNARREVHSTAAVYARSPREGLQMTLKGD